MCEFGFPFSRERERLKPYLENSRRQSFRLRSGHKCAHLYTESAEYQYLKKLDAVKSWFRGSVEQILSAYGREHNIQKEDLFLGKSIKLEVIMKMLTLDCSYQLVAGSRLWPARESCTP